MKNTTYILLGLALGVLILGGIGLYSHHPQEFGGGSSINVSYYRSATNASVVCSGATSTLILAAAARQDTRNAFNLTVVSSTITLCRSASGCSIGLGLTLAASTTQNIVTRFNQEDSYYGAYSCIGNGVSSTVGVSYNQT